jgi:hypothetical protein
MTAEETGRSRQSRSGGEIVRLLEVALAPVEPRAELGDELERRLAEVREAALGELADWELAAMRDPRNWVRPAAAVAVGTAAGAALLVVRMRHAQRRRTGLRGLADQSRRDLWDAIATARARLP